MLQLFQTRDWPFFFIVTLVYTCHAFFAVSSKNIYPIYCFGHSSSQSVSQWNSFSPFKYIVYKCYSCFRPGMGLFFFIVTLVYTCRAFLLYHQKIFVPYIVLVTARLSLFRNEILFLLSNTLSTNVTVVSDQGWAIFFHRHTCLHLSRFFCSVIRKYLSHILFWSQVVSVCFAMKFFFSLKIHCLQVFQLFQTKDGPVVFIVTFVYTCRAFFAVSSENNCPIYSFVHSSSQSVSQWNSFSPLKYIVYQCYSCFRPGMGHFFFIVTLVYTCRAFFAVSSVNNCPIYCFGHSSSQSVSQWNSFPPLKYIVYQCYSCFRPGMGHFFSSSHLSTLVTLFLLYHQKIFIIYIVLVTLRLSLFCNETLFFL